MKIRRWRSYYYGLVTLIDDMIGKMMAVLDRRGLWDNTMVVLTSDHGDMAGDFNMMEKGNFYEEVIHVPLIVVPPGSKGAQPSVSGLVEVTDVAPTILDYAGVPIPPQMAQAMSLRSLVEGSGEAREAVLCENVLKKNQPAKCIRTQRYKYVFSGVGQQPEFYDLQADPDELHNLYGDSHYAAEIDRHKDLLLDRLMRSEAPYHRDETPSAAGLRTWQ
jgi:arylsulfatase A-like enzyme